jgi:filamentous hemagglutinin
VESGSMTENQATITRLGIQAASLYLTARAVKTPVPNSAAAAKTPLALPHPKYLFKADEAMVHFDKHAKSIINAMGNKSYNLAQYVDDANHIVQTGTWVPEMNGFVKLIGGQGSAKFGFVGLERGSSAITTFHIKTASELARKAPSLGITP